MWVVAGAPGVGKTTYAVRLVEELLPRPALLDKDTVYGGFVRATLATAGRPDTEREGPWYDEHIKRYEYAGLTAAAREIRSLGCPVVLVAPFTAEIHDVQRWTAMVDGLGGPPVRLVWVHCDAGELHRRLIGRGREFDAGKLADFPAFVANIRLSEPPAVPYLDVDSTEA